MKILLLLTALICYHSPTLARAFWPDYNSGDRFGGYTDYQLDETIPNLNPFGYSFDESPEESSVRVDNVKEKHSDVAESFSNRHYYQVQHIDKTATTTPEKSSGEFAALNSLAAIQPNDEIAFEPLNGAQPNDDIKFELLNDKKETPKEIKHNNEMEEIDNDETDDYDFETYYSHYMKETPKEIKHNNEMEEIDNDETDDYDFEKYFSLYMKDLYNDDESVEEAEDEAKAEAKSEYEQASGSFNIPSDHVVHAYEPVNYFSFEPSRGFKERTEYNSYSKENIDDPELFNSLEKLVAQHSSTDDYEGDEGSTEDEAQIENNNNNNNSDKEETEYNSYKKANDETAERNGKTEDYSLDKLMAQIWGADDRDDGETPESYRKSEDNDLEKFMAQLWSAADYEDSTDAETEAEEEPKEISENRNKQRVIFSAHIPLGTSDPSDHFKFEVYGRDIESHEIVQNNNNNIEYADFEKYNTNANDESLHLVEKTTQTTSSLAPQSQEVDLLRQLSLSSSNSALLNQEYSTNVIEFLTAQENLKESLDFLQRQNEQLNLEFYLSSIVHSDYNSQQHARLETEMSAMLTKLDEAREKVLQLQSLEQKRNYHHLLEALVQEIYGK